MSVHRLKIAAAALLVLTSAPAVANAQVRFHNEAGGATVRVLSWREIPFRTVVRQEHDYSCGSAALATLLTYHYGKPTSEPQAFSAMFSRGDQAKIRKVGFSMLDMKRYLQARGIQADGFRIGLDELAASRWPAIALIDLGAYRHFVVIKGVSKDKVLVGDPAQGLRIYPRAQFMKMWNGISFAIHDTPTALPANFNAPAEWRPWAVAPVGLVESSSPLGRITNEQPYYQITPTQSLLPSGVLQ
jgi:predicted double-glycine peptidase